MKGRLYICLARVSSSQSWIYPYKQVVSNHHLGPTSSRTEPCRSPVATCITCRKASTRLTSRAHREATAIWIYCHSYDRQRPWSCSVAWLYCCSSQILWPVAPSRLGTSRTYVWRRPASGRMSLRILSLLADEGWIRSRFFEAFLVLLLISIYLKTKCWK